MAGGADILIVSVGATTGWRGAARQLRNAFEAAGADAAIVETGPVREVRTLIGTDLVQAVAARRAARAGLAERRPRAIVYCSITSALLWPAPGAIWLDSIAAENRPGRHGLWQRRVELRRLAAAPLLLTMAADSLAPLGNRARPESVVVPVPVDRSGHAPGPGGSPRDIDVLAYATDPIKRRLEFILDTWRRARRDAEQLVVTGIDRPAGAEVAGVRFTGRLAPAQFRQLLRRARVFVSAPRREDFGITALEALADGAMLVTTPAPGPYPALALARMLDPRLVSEDLVAPLRAALDDPLPGYAGRAAELVTQFSGEAVASTLADRVLPRLLPGWRS